MRRQMNLMLASIHHNCIYEAIFIHVLASISNSLKICLELRKNNKQDLDLRYVKWMLYI
jgi:hypothetical protein